jgi:hypothetical protein
VDEAALFEKVFILDPIESKRAASSCNPLKCTVILSASEGSPCQNKTFLVIKALITYSFNRTTVRVI